MDFKLFNKQKKETNVRQKAEMEAAKEKARGKEASKEDKPRAPWKVIAGIAGGIVGGLAGLLAGMALMGGVGGDIGNLEVSPLVLLVLIALWTFLVAAAVGVLIVIAWRWKSPESWFFLTKIRLGKRILVRVSDFSGNERWVDGKVSKDGLVIEWNGEQIGFSPKVFGEGRNSYHMGMDIIDFLANNWQAIGKLGANAMLSAEDYWKDAKHGFVVLPRYEDALVMHLYGLNESKLADECALAVNIDASKLSYADLPVTVKIDPLAERAEGEDDVAFTTRVKAWEAEYQQKYLEEWTRLYGRRTTVKKDAEGNDYTDWAEGEAEYKARLQSELDRVYFRIVTAETDALKKEIIKLQKETEGRLITSRAYIRREIMKMMDPRIDTAAAMKLKSIKESEKPKQEVPGFFKWVVGAVLVMVGGGVLFLLVAYALKQVGL